MKDASLSFVHRLPLAVGLAGGLALGSLISARAQIPAFPGALGFGAYATGGRTGSVYHVTTLADSGTGSFRDAVSSANRIVVFDVGGYISLSSAVSVNKNITIAGQTAPGGGIGFKGGEISFANRSNIICRFIRIRPGSDTDSHTDDCLSLYRAQNVICDHVSLEFGPWNNIGAVSDDWQNYPVTSVTFQNCLNADPSKYVSGDSEPGQQFGAHMESVSSTMSWFYTIFANSHNRNPMSKINDVFVNNVLYNCDAGYTTHTSTEFSHDIVNNYFIAGPASGSNFPWYQIDINQSIYYSGNLYDSDSDGTLDGSITTPYWYQGEGTVLTAPWSSLTTNIPIYSAATACRIAISQAGTLPRDPIDELVISQVKTLGYGTTGTGAGTAGPDGGLYNSQINTGLGNNGYGVINGGIPALDGDSDGMPDYWELAVGLSTTGNDAMTIAADGYANIEHYLNWLADPHALTATNAAVEVDLWQYTSGFTNASPVYSVFNASNGVVTLTNSHLAHFTPTADFYGLGSFQFSVTTSDSAFTNTVAVAVTPQSLAETVPSYLTWRGDGVINLWAVGDGTNWWNGTNLVAFNTGDTVTFDDTGTNTPAVNLNGVLYGGTVYVLAAQDYTLGGSGVLAGPTALFKTGSGQLNINTTNTYLGGTLINEGVVQVGDGVNFSGSIGGSITNNDTLIFNNPGPVSSSASISGSGVLIKRGAGTLTLSGTQTYTNLTTVEAGTLVLAGTPPPGNILNNSVLSFKPSGALTYAGAISGSGRVTAGTSSTTLTLSGANTFSGGITITTGNLLLGNSSAAGTGPVTNTSSGLIYVGNGVVITNDYAITTSTTDLGMRCDSGTGTWAGNVYVTGGASWRPGSGSGTLVFTGTANQGTHNFIVPRGSVHFASNAVVTATGSATALGRDTSGSRPLDLTNRDNASLTLGPCSIGGGEGGGNVTVTIQNNAALTLPANTLDLHNINRSTAVSTLRLNGGTLTVAGFTKTRSYTNVINFNGGLLVASSNNTSFLPAFSWQTVNVQAGGARIDAGNHMISIDQKLIHDPALGAAPDGGLTKLGFGALGLNGQNTFNGPTMILAGTLLCSPGAITNSSGIYIASGAELDFQVSGSLTLGQGKTLSGNGNVNGDFILGNGATLAPGTNGIGRLTFIRSLTLAVGSTNIIEVSHAPLTNDQAAVIGALTCGGTLIVTNTGGTALMAGDSFKLFSAGSYGDGFAKVILPSLNSGLAWNTNALTTSGVIAVVAAPPVFGYPTVTGSNLTLNGSGGMATSNFYVLTSTNLTLPLSNWTRLLTNQFDTNGSFNFTTALDTNAAQNFYLLQLP